MQILMNVLKVQMVVLRPVQTQLVVTLALVALAIAQLIMDADVEILMNVLKEQMAVLRLVQTQLGTTHAPVTQAIVWQVTW